ncbi:uncharacterized protein PV09_05841 [Verruconis gallopava]|uniref:Endo-chitosanase n=1 Tax=Verruconis gallopava TaxID=253628 RepID=A0A0D2AUF2_9PEZI|nr:uncharacterized protein PV09_05841 [Verruconis gallopava]KIW02779.1 hypothetical protein PV09_05841 [Verruconis gallopava]
MKKPFNLAVIGVVANISWAREIPPNARAFYNRIKNDGCDDGVILQSGFYNGQRTSQNFSYCQDNSTKVIYIHTGSDFASMSVDCNGDQSDRGDGRCGSAQESYHQTYWKDIVEFYSKGKVFDVNTNFIPYVEFGNYAPEASGTKFDPTQWGIQPLSVMAVICGDKIVYGVWADVNLDSPPLIGRASLALATECYGIAINESEGHKENDVLYIAFSNAAEDTVVRNAAWNAKSFKEFETSISETGDLLVEKLF